MDKIIETESAAVEATVLGQRISAPTTYTPDILVAVPRSENRLQYAITGDEFVGYDAWHAYEVSFVTKNGLPIHRIANILYSSDSEFIVESKSLKLYLNSFNMFRSQFTTVDECQKWVTDTIKTDLSNLLKTDVKVNIFDMKVPEARDVYANVIYMNELDGIEDIQFESYNEDWQLLKVIEKDEVDNFTFIGDIRSNCKVTHQPDWGTVYITIEEGKGVDLTSLARYLISFRNESHFHEEVCEMIYKRLMNVYQPSGLRVVCKYTRRGGIDICPIRCSNAVLLVDHSLAHPTIKTIKEFNQ